MAAAAGAAAAAAGRGKRRRTNRQNILFLGFNFMKKIQKRYNRMKLDSLIAQTPLSLPLHFRRFTIGTSEVSFKNSSW